MTSIAYAPFGVRLQSQGEMPTDRLFTGQRLDSTGLYYYGARYYDPSVGRFISPDKTAPHFNNPQSLNKYSYVINNPTSAVDPNGLDYIFVGGANSKSTDNWWKDMLGALNWDRQERVTFISDARPPGPPWESYDQASQSATDLATGDYHDIKLIGHSEGAAAIATVLNSLAENDQWLGSGFDRSQLKGAVLLDMPTGLPSIGVKGWDDGRLTKLPDRIAAAGIDMDLADIHGTWIHGAEFEGWEGISYQVYDPWLLGWGIYGEYTYLNPDYIFGHNDLILEPETIDIIRDTFGIDD